MSAPESDEELPYVGRYELLGLAAEVASDSTDLIALLDVMNSEFPPPAGMPALRYRALRYAADAWELTCDGAALGWRHSLLAAAGRLEWHMTDRAIDARPDLIHLHGAALAGPAGALLLPGGSGIGKTTLALALWRRGLLLYADDVAFFQPMGWQPLPFPRTLHVHDDALARLRALGLRHDPADRVGAYLLARALRPWPAALGPSLRWLLFLEAAGDEPPTLRPVTDAEAAVALLRLSRTLRRKERHGLDLLAALMREAECFVLRAGPDPSAAADLVCRLVNGKY